MDKKKTLKSAREAIQQKNFKEALQLCTEVLSNDEDYMALVFGGLCHSELDDVGSAKTFYMRASKLEPEKLPAWQGLFKLYDENKIGEDEAVLECCQKLASTVSSDDEKASSYELAVVKCLLKLNRLVELGEVVDKSRQANTIALLVVSQLSGKRDLSADAIHLCQKCFTVLRSASPLDPSLLQLESSFSFEYEPLDAWFIVALDSFAASSSTSEEAKLVLGLSMQLLLDVKIDNDVISRISSATTDATVSALCEAVKALSGGDFTSALASVEKADKKKDSPLALAGQLLLLPSLLHFHRFEEAVTVSQSSISAVGKMSADYSALLSHLTYRLCRALYGVHTAESLEKCSTLLRTREDQASKILLAYAAADSGKTADAWRVLSDCADSSPEYHCALAWCHLADKNTEEAKANILKALMADGGDQQAWFHFVMGRALWDGGRRDAVVLKEFLQAAKLDPHDGDAFFYLGRYYLEVGSDTGRAVRCLERAAALRPKSEAIAHALNDAYSRAKDTNKQLELLSRIVASHPISKCVWARLQLGLLLAAGGRAAEAVDVLQALVRVQADNADAWELLGDAYEARGAYESAVKCFERVVALRPDDCAYAKTRAAAIDVHVGDFEAAIDTCRAVLAQQPDQLLANALLSKALLKLAALHWDDTRYERALEDLVAFFHAAAKFVALSDSSCAWKLLGDGCELLTRFGNVRIAALKLKLPTAWHADSRLMAAKRAVNCYINALRRNGAQTAAAWHDLAVALLRVVECDSVGAQGGMAEQAVSCLKKAISLAESDQLASVYWTTLGAALQVQERRELARHCLVRALQLDKFNATAYCHLGLLYLSNGMIDLAHEALSKAQDADPSLAASWCYQAIIADTVDHYDRVDLFRHTLQLSNLPIAAKNYAYFVLKNLVDDRNIQSGEKHSLAVCSARDALQKLTAIDASNSDYLVPLSLLMERDAMYSLALSQLIRGEITPSDDVNAIRLKIKLFENGCTKNMAGIDAATQSLLTCLQSLYSANLDELSRLLSSNKTELGSFLEAVKSGAIADSSGTTQYMNNPDLVAVLIAAENGSLKWPLPLEMKKLLEASLSSTSHQPTIVDEQKEPDEMAPPAQSEQENEENEESKEYKENKGNEEHVGEVPCPEACPSFQPWKTLLLAAQSPSATNIQRLLHERPWLFRADQAKVISNFLHNHKA
uniref:Tetratricopeptide repeat domain 37 n=1 Tax=Plectus sambesii TaxID=2011161 RepID=A0A914WE84_9BILA